MENSIESCAEENRRRRDLQSREEDSTLAITMRESLEDGNKVTYTGL